MSLCENCQICTATTQQLEQQCYRDAYQKALAAARQYGKFDVDLGCRLDKWTLAGLTGIHEDVCKAALTFYYSQRRN